ncbi:hypothetical protein MTR67_036506, partial [Solanum verrucosum]
NVFYSSNYSPILFVRAYYYNWNRVSVNYCDGSLFTGDVEEVDPVSRYAILSGSSARGLATILNCDKFNSFFSNDSIMVKCVASAGFFIDM